MFSLHENIISRFFEPVNEPGMEKLRERGFSAIAAESTPGPRRKQDDSIIQFSDVDLGEKSGEYPFKGIPCDPLIYEDLASVTLVTDPYSIKTDYEYAVVPVTGQYGMLVPKKVLNRIGRLALSVVGKLMIGVYFYSHSSKNGEHEYTVYKPEIDGQLTVIPADRLTDSSSSAINKRMDSLFRITVMLMDDIGLGYKVDVDAVGVGCHVISKTASGSQIRELSTPSEVVPCAWLHAPQDRSFAENVDSLMSSQVFASEKDYANFCMGVFYSVMGLDGAHYFIMTDEGGSGKSTLMKGLSNLIPSLATTALQIENMSKTGFERGMTVSQLVSKKIAIQDEVVAIRPTAMRMLNAVSSGTTMEARYGGGVFQYVDLKLALWFAGNTDVELPGIDAVRRRRVDIYLKNQMTQYDWEQIVDWDSKQRPLYELARSREAFTVMFLNGMGLWSERDGEFFEVDRLVDGSADAIDHSKLARLVEAAGELQKHEGLVGLLAGLTEEDLEQGHVCKSVSMVGVGKSVVNIMRDNGFSLKRTSITGPDRRKPISVRYLVIDDEKAVRTLQRTMVACQSLSDMKLSPTDLDDELLASVVTGETTVDEIVETMEKNGHEYAMVPVSGPRPSLAAMIRRQHEVAPMELIGSGFIRSVSAEVFKDRRCRKAFVTAVPWSKVNAVEDGDKWALVLGLRKTVDMETGEAWIGGLDEIDTYDTIDQIGCKYMNAWH